MKLLHLLAATLLVASPALADSAVEKGKKISESIRDTMMKPGAMDAWMKTTQPGLPHEFLNDAFVGEWTTTSQVFMDQSGEPMVSEGKATVKPIMGGKFIEETFEGAMMGQPFSGRSTVGYDNVRKLFVSSWVDSMSTGITQMYGSISLDGTMMTFVGEMFEPMSGEMGKAYKLTITLDSPDQHTARMYEVVYGEPFMVMEIVYKRAE